MLHLAVLDVAAGGGPLEIAVELDAVGRVEIDALHLAPETFALGQAGHDLERVAKNHAVRPVLIMFVKFCFVDAFGNAVEVGEQVPCLSRFSVLLFLGLAAKIINKYLGVTAVPNSAVSIIITFLFIAYCIKKSRGTT